MSAPWRLRCVVCEASYAGDEVRYRCDCGEVLDVVHDFSALSAAPLRETFARRKSSLAPIDRSGVWRFREIVLPLDEANLVAKPEGNTNLYDSPALAAHVGLERLALKHEGENPTGSFKDRGMTAGVSAARAAGLSRVACASTGNTSASMAAYAAAAGFEAYVFVPDGGIAYGKLSQALAYGARTVQIAGDFDDAMRLVEEICRRQGVYLLNSVNPFRIEGQKAIGIELLEDRGWKVPDWIVLPGGNLGNSSALAKGLGELLELGLIDRLPRIAVVQAAGAAPLYRAWREGEDVRPVSPARTIATAIKIGAPVSWRKCLRGLAATGGVVESVTDQEILDAKARVDGAGIGAEPASCTTVAGIAKLVAAGVIAPDADVVAILTGNLLKDPDVTVRYHLSELEGFSSPHANAPVRAEATYEGVLAAMGISAR